MTERLLRPCRILDLTGEKGWFCGKLLGDLGADVVKIEPPGGDPERMIGPFFGGRPDPEASIYWWALNTSKKSVTLDVGKPEGGQIFRRLVTSAEFVIESCAPGYLDELGLGYSTLSEINPGLVLTSITPFGQDGPRARWQSSDLILMAAGGAMNQTGDADRPPLRFYMDQAYCIAGAHAAASSLIADYYRQATGKGQHVDISIQECVAHLATPGVTDWEFERKSPKRSGSRSRRHPIRYIWPCKDGYLTWMILGGTGEQENRALAVWLKEEVISDRLCSVDWARFDMSKPYHAEMEKWQALIERLFLRYTRKELEEEALRRGIRLVGLNSVKEAVEGEHFASRDFWVKTAPPLREESFRYPGRIFQCASAETKVRSPAPVIGEHNEDIYGQELGMTTPDLAQLKNMGVI